MSEMENEVSKAGDALCCVCHNSPGVPAHSAIKIFGDKSNIQNIQCSLQETIQEFSEKSPQKGTGRPPVICKKCYKLLEEHENLKSRMIEIKSIIQQNSKNPTHVDKQNASKINSSESLLGGKSLIKKEEISQNPVKKEVTLDNKTQKKIPVISMKNLTKLPSSFVVVNQQGKIAVQNLAATSKNTALTNVPQVKESAAGDSFKQAPKSILLPEVPKKPVATADKPSSLVQEHKLVVKENTAASGSDKLIEVREEDEQDDEGAESQMEEDDEGDMQETVYEGVEALEDMEEDGENFVISHMEILDDHNMELEEGTILVEQKPDGTIRLLRHTGELLEEGYINEEDEGSEAEMEEQSIKYQSGAAENASQRRPRIVRTKPTNKSSIGQSKKGPTSTTISSECYQSFDGLVKQIDEQLFQCLVCKKEVPDGDNTAVQDKKTDIKKEISGDVKNEEGKSDDEDDKPSQEDGDEKHNSSFIGESKMLTQHMRSAHKMSIHICHVCGEIFSRKNNLTIHLDKHHISSDGHAMSEYKCLRCGDTFESLKAIRLHAKNQHKDVLQKQHVCLVCNRKFGSKKLLEEHNNMHIGVKPYTCVMCGKSFASKYTYQSHSKTHTDRPRPYSCGQCGKSFFTIQNKMQHEKTHLGIKDFVCNVCGKAFGTQHNLNVHGVVHTGYKPYQCQICKKSFARRAEIKDHERIHTGERPFGCNICGASFSQRSNLQSHKRATHYDDKRYKCRNCDKSFKRRRLLEYHIKSTHTGERPYKCDICEATFVYPEHFKKHTRIHSGEKPYTCEVCGKAFTSRDNRNAHRFIHSDKKPYECLDCGAGFMRKPLLYAHMQQQGHLNDTIIVNQPRINNDNNMDGKTGLELDDAFILEDGQVIIDNIKQEVLGEDQLERKITLASSTGETFETEFVDVSDKLIVRTATGATLEEGITAVEPDELVAAEGGEATIITGDIIDTQNIHIIEAEDSNAQTLETEDGLVRIYQVRLPNGDDGWVALNNPQEEA